MSSSRVVLVVLLLSMISMQGIQYARGLGVELEPEKVTKALKKEDKVLASIKQLVSSVAMTLLQRRQEHEDGPSSAGKGSIITSSDQDTKWKAMRRQARSVKDGTKEAEGAFDSSDEKGVGEDVVVMDYALPHRKPPIHNEKS